MSKHIPIVADNKPQNVDLEAGQTYLWCACGRSQEQPFCDHSQPFCDGSQPDSEHDLQPVEFKAEKNEEAWLCMCKHTHTRPFCDGTHQQFNASQVGKPIPLDFAVDKDKTGEAESHHPEDDAPKAVPTPEEPTVAYIHQLAREGLKRTGPDGPLDAMGVPGPTLPRWNDLQIMVAQLATKPLMDDHPVATELVIGPEAKKPLMLKIPLFVSDMSFGALSREAKIALARGAELAGTGICSGEGGMLPEEQAENSRYFFELASARFGYREELLHKVQAFHFKGGQAAKTGTGGHLPGPKVTPEIAAVRHIEAGKPAISPAAFADLTTPADFRRFADHVREITGGIPIGFKISANRIEPDIQFALDASADYIILDGRGGGTGAAPLLFRDNISVPTIPALARARRYLDQQGASGRVTLIITGGLRVPADFIKAMALGADGIALANSAIQAVGCVGARICHTNNCPTGITTQKPELRRRLNVDKSATQLATFFDASVSLMKVMARACGHDALGKFNIEDLATWHRELAWLSGVRYAGVTPIGSPD